MKRTTDRNVIEHRLLELAYTTDARITPSVLAYFAPCSIEDAERVLDDLTARDRIQMHVDDDGAVWYEVPDRQKLQPRREERELPPPALATISPMRPLALRVSPHASPALAAIFSMFIPGAGQFYAGRWVAGILWFLAVSAGYALILPGLVLHLFCIVSAASSAHRLNSNLSRFALESG